MSTPVTHAAPEPLPLACPALEQTVALWWCSLVQPPGTASVLAEWLSPAERQRAARFGPGTLRERYIIGRATLRRLLSRTLDVPPAEVSIVRGRRGRPVLDRNPEVDFNVSHTKDVAVFAIAPRLAPERRVGIDVEHLSRTPDVTRLARKVLSPDERASLDALGHDDRRVRFLETWTCKEAMSKATGDGLRAPFGSIVVEPSEPPRVLDGPAPYTPERWQLHRLRLESRGCIATVALHQT